MIEATETRSAPAIEDLRVLIVDDHDLFRTGLRNLLEEQGVQIVGEAASGNEALRLVRELAPDVVVMDLNMPGMTGVEATRQIATIAPLTRVVVLTISDEDADVMDAILAGACGYLLKDASITELLSGIRSASVGESLISPTIAAKVLQRVRAATSQPDIEATIRAELSDREIEVLKLIANGKDNAVIANELHISPKTVKNHRSTTASRRLSTQSDLGSFSGAACGAAVRTCGLCPRVRLKRPVGDARFDAAAKRTQRAAPQLCGRATA
jgi:DNA-binding NarL/FixJ family response regulator